MPTDNKRFICIHGHFYQPPRENPWLEEIELQDSAYPYHDWNDRISAECYAPNTASRMLDRNKRIIDIVNNYSTISFDFGPTLLSWLEKHDSETYKKILEADKESQKTFSGHGSAMAQCYNHLIMPLANSRDKKTQVIWGLKDFEHRFSRKPEGMWLPEAGVDIETLELLAEYGIKFTILSPQQAKSVRKIGDTKWLDVTNERIDPKIPYLLNLPSGKTISLFFFDGPISRDLAFGNLLDNGEYLASRLMNSFTQSDTQQLVNVATDGETFGHHHHYGDMALTYCIHHIEKNPLAKMTIYPEFLEKYPPVCEVEIFENSSWSCVHGIQRWSKDCGCNSGMHHGWNQQWRAPLREALNWVRDNLINLYHRQMSQYVEDPWKARDEYIEVILDRSRENVERFLNKHSLKQLTPADKVCLLKLLEMQRDTMLMYTSCGWFFDEISGIETTQIMHYAARAIRLARELSGINMEDEFVKLLSRAPSNIKEFGNGAKVYDIFIRPNVLDILRVGVHYAVSSLFEDYPDKTNIYSFSIETQLYDRTDVGKQKLVIGKSQISSDITMEQDEICFAVFHLGDHNLIAGVYRYGDTNTFNKMCREIKDTFVKGDISATMHSIEKYFNNEFYSLVHLFKDEQRKVLNEVLASSIQGIESLLRQINENYYPAIAMMKQTRIPLPQVLETIFELILNTDLRLSLESPKVDLNRLQKLVEESKKWATDLDKMALGHIAGRKINSIMEEFDKNPKDHLKLELVKNMLTVLKPLELPLNLWKAQNIYFSISRDLYKQKKNALLLPAENIDEINEWLLKFETLGTHLDVEPTKI